MFYILGIITGILLSLLFFIVARRPETHRAIQKVEKLTGKKGSILDAESDNLDNWVNSL